MRYARLDRWSPSRRSISLLACALVLAVLTAGVRAGQAAPSALTGTVYDAMGGVMPGVQIALIDAAQTLTSVNSAATGRFTFPSVAPGKYVIEAKLPGFRTLRNEVELRSAADWQRVMTLQIGDLHEDVSIRGNRAAAQPAAAASPAAPVRVGGSVRVPRKLTDVAPVYPVAMQSAGMGGLVPLEAVIGRDGSVSSVRVLSAQIHPELAGAAMDAVRQWRYSPTLLNGVAVEVMMTVNVTFDLAR